MGRFIVVATALALHVLASRSARAQFAPQGVGMTELPVAVDLKKVAVGSWAEYRSGDERTSVDIRLAVVSRSPRSVDIETEISGGPMLRTGAMILRMSIPLTAAAEATPARQVLQIGQNEPMLLPTTSQRGPTQVIKKVDPKQRRATEEVRVPAGVFENADHYVAPGEQGATTDYWTRKDLPPLGLIKMIVTMPHARSRIVMELIRSGEGATPLIQKRPRAFNANVMMREATAAAAVPSSSRPPNRSP